MLKDEIAFRQRLFREGLAAEAALIDEEVERFNRAGEEKKQLERDELEFRIEIGQAGLSDRLELIGKERLALEELKRNNLIGEVEYSRKVLDLKKDEFRTIQELEHRKAAEIKDLAREAQFSWSGFFEFVLSGASSVGSAILNMLQYFSRLLPGAGTAGTVGAGIGGILSRLTGGGGLGSSIGGGLGGILGNLGGGALGAAIGFGLSGTAGVELGAAIGGPVGAVVGAIGGSLIGGLFGGKKDKDPIRRAIKEWVSGTLWPALQDLKRVGFGPGIFGSFRPSGTDFFKLLGFTEGIPQQVLARMQQMAKDLRGILANAIDEGFSAFSPSSGFDRFLRDLREGLADHVRQGLIKGLIKGSALTQALAPFFEEIEKTSRQFRKGKIGPEEFEAGALAAFQAILPSIEALEPMFSILAGIADNLEKTISGRGGAGGFIPVGALQQAHTGGLVTRSGAIEVQAGERILKSGQPIQVVNNVTVTGQFSSGRDAERLGEDIGWGAERHLRRVVL